MLDLPKTEQELNDLIEAKVKEKTDALNAQHDGAMASIRKKHADELAKVKEQAGISAEQLAQEKIKEQQEADARELAELRAYKKTNELSSKLAKEGLPDYFKHDQRLINADETSVDSVLKSVKKEYEATLPKGATTSTVVKTGGANQPQADTKAETYARTGEALKEALGI